jgi:hypothetical protein
MSEKDKIPPLEKEERQMAKVDVAPHNKRFWGRDTGQYQKVDSESSRCSLLFNFPSVFLLYPNLPRHSAALYLSHGYT